MKKYLRGSLAVILVFAILCPLTVFSGVAAPPAPAPEDWYDAFEDTEGWYDDDWDDDLYIWEDYGYDTAEEFLESYIRIYGDISFTEFFSFIWWSKYYDISNEEYQALEEAWNKAREELRLRRLKELEELGGTPGIINIMYNDSFIKFPGAVTEITDGSTFVPALQFFETLGATVSFDGQKKAVIAEFEDRSAIFVMGRDIMTILENDKEEEFFIYSEPYIKNGVSYIPVRAVAEALGFDVFWDNIYKAVVVIDKKAIIEEIDKDFTIVNSLLAMSFDAEVGDGTHKTVFDIAFSITQFDSLDGDTTGNANANITIISDGLNFSMKGAADISAIIDLYLADLMRYSYYYDEEELEMIIRQYDMFRKIEAEIIFNYDEDIVYVKAPLLSEVLPGLPADAWISVSNVSRYFERLGYMMGSGYEYFTDGLGISSVVGGASMGEILYAELSYYAYPWSRNQIFMYSDLMDSVGYGKAFIGDEKFAKNGNDYTLIITFEDMIETAKEFDEYLDMSLFDLEVTIKTNGASVTGVTGSVVWRDDYYYITQYKCELDISSTEMYFYFEVHEKNEMAISIEITASTVETNQAIPSGPPAGAKIIAIEDLFPDDFFGWGPGDIVVPLAEVIQWFEDRV